MGLTAEWTICVKKNTKDLRRTEEHKTQTIQEARRGCTPVHPPGSLKSALIHRTHLPRRSSKLLNVCLYLLKGA